MPRRPIPPPTDATSSATSVATSVGAASGASIGAASGASIGAATGAPGDAELALFSDLDEAVIRLDAAGRLDYANERARRLLGVPQSAHGSLPLLTTTAPWLAAALETAAGATTALVMDVHDARRNRWLGCRIYPVAGGMVVLIEDVTLRQLADLARQRVLLQAAGHSSPADIAHQLNNAIMALVGNVELMESGLAAHPELQELHESMTEVCAAADRALALARQLVESAQGHGAAVAAVAAVTHRRTTEPRPSSRQRPRGGR